MFTFSGKYWTSDLIISADKDLDQYISGIESILNTIRDRFSLYKESDNYGELDVVNADILNGYGILNNDKLDFTCMLKGLAIDNIRKLFNGAGFGSYIISFGGDIYGFHAPVTKIPIEGTDFQVMIEGNFSVFTSGNTERRGNHIIGGEEGRMSTVVYKWMSDEVTKEAYWLNTIADAVATKSVISDFSDPIDTYCFSEYRYVLNFKDGILLNEAYCASPFFNKEQIEVRDRMISKFRKVFRPDLQPNAIEFNKDQSDRNELAKKVVEDNELGISNYGYLVFPNDTDDLGTLYEVGMSISMKSRSKLIKFNPSTGIYTVCVVPAKNVSIDGFVINCGIKSGAILLGYLAKNKCTDKYYMLDGCPDNIMLSMNFTHVEFNGSTYNVYEKKSIEDTSLPKVVEQRSDIGDLVIDDADKFIDLNYIYDTDIEVSENVVTSVS